MEKFLDKIINDFDIKNENINIFEFSKSKNHSLEKLKNAYDFFLKNQNLKKSLLFMEFKKKIQQRIEKKIEIKKNKIFERNLQNRLSFSKRKNYTFILLDPETKKLLLKNNFFNKNFFSFFYLEENNEKEALDKFQKKMKTIFDLDLQKNNYVEAKNLNPYFSKKSKLFFCHISEQKIRRKLRNDFSLKFLEIENQIIFKNSKYSLISNFYSVIKHHLENQNENQIFLKRKKSASVPLKIALKAYLEKEDIKQIRKNQEFIVIDKIMELKRNLDDILKKHNLDSF